MYLEKINAIIKNLTKFYNDNEYTTFFEKKHESDVIRIITEGAKKGYIGVILYINLYFYEDEVIMSSNTGIYL